MYITQTHLKPYRLPRRQYTFVQQDIFSTVTYDSYEEAVSTRGLLRKTYVLLQSLFDPAHEEDYFGLRR